jgi:CO/xanthine dehydrogenase Mo-binding subunit
MTAAGIGAPVRRKEDRRFITGKGRYTDDINRPGQAFAYFVRSPHAHAFLNGIDVSRALAAPGCVAVFTGADIAKDKCADCMTLSPMPITVKKSVTRSSGALARSHSWKCFAKTTAE